jgi:hypothetical protein
MMHEPINVKSPNNTSKWHVGFNSAFKGLKKLRATKFGNGTKTKGVIPGFRREVVEN